MSRIKAAAAKSHMTLDQAAQRISDLAACQRHIDQLKMQADAEILKIKNELAAAIEPYNQQIKSLFSIVHLWAEANRNTLCPKKKKSVDLITGVLAWRMTPKKVSLKGKERIIKQLRNLENKGYLRITYDVNKEEILANPDGVKYIDGIKISQHEEFSIKPSNTNLEIVKKV